MPTRSARSELTPQMSAYLEKFDDHGDIRWLPYLMYFHPSGHGGEIVQTDPIGFRISRRGDERASAGGNLPNGPVRLLAGSSTVFGIGATADAATIPSRLWTDYAPGTPWLNFGGRSHNPTQELLLFVLYRHLVPNVEEIVLFSGFNALGLARLPSSMQGDNGAFFNCVEYFEKMAELRRDRSLRRRRKSAEEDPPSLDEQIDRAVDLTVRHLDTWRLLAEASGARLRFVLQPLATWIREEPAPEEKMLFDELDRIASFSTQYGDIAMMRAGTTYAERLRRACEAIGVAFLDFNPVLAEAVGQEEWLFVDRIHFNDHGYDVVARLLAEALDTR